MAEHRQLPEVSNKDLLIWDADRSQCCGYLLKKASKSSVFSKGNLQKRWFFINIDLEPKENYCLSYSHSADDSKPKQVSPLVNANVKLAGGNSFVVQLIDDTTLTLSSESNEVMKNWVDTLTNVISVANLRERMMHERTGDDHGEHGGDTDNKISRKAPSKASFMKAEMTSPSNNNEGDERSGHNYHPHSPNKSPHRIALSANPTLRLDIDANTIPPSSTSRHQFLELFVADLAKALEVVPEMIEILSVKPAPGMDWLTSVEFDIAPQVMLPADPDGREDLDYMEELAVEQEQLRARLLWTLHEMVFDPNSVLYNGFVTSKLDPSFALNLIDKGANVEEDFVPYSSDPSILSIMEQYKDIQVPANVIDITHFTIELYFENKTVSLLVPNPQILRRGSCAIWPYEVKQALGLMGTMQELWIEPVALVPKDMPKLLSQPIPFEPSVRYGGAKLINAIRLKADQSYDVICEDRRDDALNSLSKEEMDSIKETFQRCDINSDGGISRTEMGELVRQRTMDRKAAIEDKFESFLTEPGITEQEIMSAESNKARYLQQLNEAQVRLLKMFEAADTNGDGVISFTEFIMAEAWWLRCTINPERAHLF